MSLPSRAPVPKFGSFRPKAVALPAPTGDVATGRQANSSHHRRQSHSRGRDETRHSKRSNGECYRHHEDRDDRRRHEKTHLSGKQRSPPPPKVAQDEFEESDLFIIDKRGDAKNVEYGSLHRYSVPAYHRIGYGRIIGTPNQAKIDRDASSEKAIIIGSSDKSRSEREPRPLSVKSRAAESHTLRLIVPETSTAATDEVQDFIALRPLLKRKRGSESPDLIQHNVDYRSIEGKAKPHDEPQDDDLEYASESDIDDAQDVALLQVQQRNAVLNRKAKENPSDLNAWLALIEHQAEVVRPGADLTDLSNKDQRTIADLRVSLIDKALKHITKGTPGHEVLLLRHLEEGSLIWDTAKQERTWTQTLDQHPKSFLLWSKYLDRIQTDHLNFEYEKCKSLYIQCLKMAHSEHGSGSTAIEADVGSTKLHLLLRLTTFARDAGYEEYAYALWQILLEYHFFKPPNLEDRERELESLENFWESDVPRIGEEGAVGWADFAAHGGGATRCSSTTPGSTPLVSKNSFAAFAQQETEATETSFLSAATDDDSTINDPFRLVMFSDLRDTVECLMNGVPKDGLVAAFLSFMRLPPLPSDGSSTVDPVAWRSDPFLHSNTTTWDWIEGEVSAASLIEDLRVHNERVTTFHLFFDAFRKFDRTVQSLNDGGTAIKRFIDQVLDRLVSADPYSNELVEYFLAFKLQCFPNEARKSAKQLLKSWPSSLRLYNAYALILVRLDELPKAMEVCSLALNMASNLSDEGKDDKIILWHNWTMTLVYEDREPTALTCFLSMLDCAAPSKPASITSSNISAGRRLSITRHLEEAIEQMMLKQKPYHVVVYVECLAWLSYLLDAHDIRSPQAVFDRNEVELAKMEKKVPLELLRQAKARLLKFHMDRRRPYKPAAIKMELNKSVTMFSDNSLFLEVLAQVSAHTRIDDRLRNAAHDDLLQRSAQDGLVRCAHAIAEELRRSTFEGSGSTNHSVRSLFSRTLLDSTSHLKSSPMLWTAWFKFECYVVKTETSKLLGASQHDLQRLKQVFYDGLRRLPWYKPWVIMGLQCFSQCPGLAEEELRQIYEALGERELRVRHEVVDDVNR